MTVSLFGVTQDNRPCCLTPRVLEELMESLDCCVPPMTNKRQGNQLDAMAFNIPLNPGGDIEICWSLPVA